MAINLEMEMRPCRKTSGADITDDLPLHHACARADGDAAHMGIACAQTAGMRQLDHITIAPRPSGQRDNAIGNSADGRAGHRGIVRALVEARIAEQRMEAHAET